MNLLPLSRGVYGADLGPDPRDKILSRRAFGPNLERLCRLKTIFDPSGVLSYACPLPRQPIQQRLAVLVTGDSGAGKDFCASIWADMCNVIGKKAHVTSISDTTKRRYAASTGAHLRLLLRDRAYKEQHRSSLSTYFQDHVRRQPSLPEENFQAAMNSAIDLDVTFVTGLREKAPVSKLAHLASDCRLVEVNIQATVEARDVRRGTRSTMKHPNRTDDDGNALIFDNSVNSREPVKAFARQRLLPLLHDDIRRLASMVPITSDFPSSGIRFRHVLNISQHQDGLHPCTSMFEKQFAGDWSKIDAVACCESGGFVFASPLAAKLQIPLALIRKGGKLPPPTFSTGSVPSHISSSAGKRETVLEMSAGVLSKGSSVVVIDDVIASGETLCAVLHLLTQSGVEVQNINIMIVAEFPAHRGRRKLHQSGFGGVSIQSLVVFSGK